VQDSSTKKCIIVDKKPTTTATVFLCWRQGVQDAHRRSNGMKTMKVRAQGGGGEKR
jgi:hypothetical protein